MIIISHQLAIRLVIQTVRDYNIQSSTLRPGRRHEEVTKKFRLFIIVQRADLGDSISHTSLILTNTESLSHNREADRPTLYVSCLARQLKLNVRPPECAIRAL